MGLRRPGFRLLRRRPPQIYLHIGAMKTGTTYLQDLMTANREELARAGVLFPGTRWAEQSTAAADVLGFAKDDPERQAQLDGRWAAMAEAMLEHRGLASVFSMEFLSFADAEQAARVVESLEGADLHVVLTVRDAASTIPAQWQTSCRNGGKVPYRKFVYGVERALANLPDEDRAVRIFRRTQGIGRMLAVWVPLVGADHVHVVTVPPRGSDPKLLWQRFASVVGVDPAVCTNPVPNTNPSLGHASTELLRKLNVELGPLTREDHSAVMKGPLARWTLGTRADQESPIRLHRRGRVFAAKWNRRVRRVVRRREVDVVGDLADLPVRRPPADVPRTLYQVSDEELLEAAATARDGLLAFRAELQRQIAAPAPPEKKPVELFLESATFGTTTPRHWDAHDDPVKAAVSALAELVRSCIELHHEWEAARRHRGGTLDDARADDALGAAGPRF